MLAGDKVFRQKKLGDLFNLKNAWLNQQTGNPEFKDIDGP